MVSEIQGNAEAIQFSKPNTLRAWRPGFVRLDVRSLKYSGVNVGLLAGVNFDESSSALTITPSNITLTAPGQSVGIKLEIPIFLAERNTGYFLNAVTRDSDSSMTSDDERGSTRISRRGCHSDKECGYFRKDTKIRLSL